MINEFNPLYSLRLLVIDDEIKFLENFSKTIKRFNHDITCMNQSGKAIKKVRDACKNNCPFDVVFVDFLMPGLDGVEVAEELKEIDPDLILIAITRDKTIQTKVRIIDSLVFDLFIPKSVTLKQLERLFITLISTKFEQRSGDSSSCAQQVATDQQQAKQARKDKES